MKFKYVEDARKFAKMLQGFLELADEVEALGSLEQQAKELDKRIAALKEHEKKAKADAIAAESAHAEAVNSMEKAVNDARAQAEVMIQDASTKAKGIFEKAKQDAEGVLLHAGSVASNISKECQEQKEKAAKLDAEIKAKEAKLAELDAKLSAIKASLGV